MAKEDNLEGTHNLLTCIEEGHEHLLHLFVFCFSVTQTRAQQPLNTCLWSTVAAKEEKQYYMGTVHKINPKRKVRKKKNYQLPLPEIFVFAMLFSQVISEQTVVALVLPRCVTTLNERESKTKQQTLDGYCQQRMMVYTKRFRLRFCFCFVFDKLRFCFFCFLNFCFCFAFCFFCCCCFAFCFYLLIFFDFWMLYSFFSISHFFFCCLRFRFCLSQN